MSAVQRPEELHGRVEARVTELTEIVRARLHGFPMPAIGYFDSRAAAGLAYYHAFRIELNATLLREHTADMLHDTIAHEMAHLACYYAANRLRVIPGTGRGHGRHWQGIMRSYFGIEPRRTHNYDLSTVRVKRQHRWRAECGCEGGCILTTARRNKMLRGATYRCAKCKQRLAFPDERVS